jgi:hypothetical protein
VIAGLSKAGAGDKSDITGTDDCNIHSGFEMSWVEIRTGLS